MKRLYLDASVIIYITEANPQFTGAAKSRIIDHLNDSQALILTSKLSRLECRVRPLRDRNQELLADYERFFAGERLELVDVTPDVLERATELRAAYRFKTPDAIHLATALEHGAEAVLTGDPQWQRCEQISVEIVR